MRLSLSLRTRFVAALLLVATLLSGGYYYSVDQVVELFETEMQHRVLDRELEAVVAALARDRNAGIAPRESMKVFRIEDERDLRTIPEQLISLAPHHYLEVAIEGRAYQASRRDMGTTRVILALDVESIESLERELVQLAYFIIAGGLSAAAIVGFLLARAVTGPVSRLADRVTKHNPTDRGTRIADPSEDPEIGRIGAAFDRFLDRLEQYVDRERAFTDEASHELRTPLAIINSSVQLMRRDPSLDSTTHQRVARIERATSQMQSLIEALLFLTRSGGHEYTEGFDLAELLQDSCDIHRDLLGGRELVLHCHAHVRRPVLAPKGLVQSVINNLLNNAIRHTSRGHIHVRLQDNCLTVEDTGSGIPAEDVAHIFELGYRGRQSRGSGLGLHLVRRICDRLGWTIAVSSNVGVGTTFHVSMGSA